MIRSLHQIQNKWQRQQQRLQRALARAIKEEQTALRTLMLLREKNECLREEIEALRIQLFTPRTIALDSYHLVNRHCASLTGRLAEVRAEQVEANDVYDKTRTAKAQLSESLNHTIIQLDQLELRINAQLRAQRIHAAATAEEDALESWLCIKSSTVSNGYGVN